MGMRQVRNPVATNQNNIINPISNTLHGQIQNQNQNQNQNQQLLNHMQSIQNQGLSSGQIPISPRLMHQQQQQVHFFSSPFFFFTFCFFSFLFFPFLFFSFLLSILFFFCHSSPYFANCSSFSSYFKVISPSKLIHNFN